MSKLTQIIESHLPKEKELWTPKSFPEGKEGLIDNETINIAIQNAKEMRSNDYELGFNSCLAEIKKAIPKMEKEIMNSIADIYLERRAWEDPITVEDILTTLTK